MIVPVCSFQKSRSDHPAHSPIHIDVPCIEKSIPEDKEFGDATERRLKTDHPQSESLESKNQNESLQLVFSAQRLSYEVSYLSSSCEYCSSLSFCHSASSAMRLVC